MSKPSRALLSALVSAVGGTAVVAIAAVVTGALAMVTRATTSLPGIFTATGGETNGLASLSFQPHAFGMLLVVLVFAVVGAFLGWHHLGQGPQRDRGNPPAQAD